MERVSVRDIEPAGFEIGAECRGLADPLGTTDVAINRYRAEPGERFSGGLHCHVDQEEVFIVVSGEATFETMDGEIVVGDGEVIRFGPGEYQSGKNAADRDVVVYALGAPAGTEDVRVPLACPDCGHVGIRPSITPEDGTTVLRCPDCGEESAVECSACGGDDKRVVLAEDGETPVDVCLDCGAESPAY